MLAFASLASSAQVEGSLGSYSPYTMYGIGDLAVGGNMSSRAMGGIGVAIRDESEYNYLNPASLSAIPQRTAIFNFAGISNNYYQDMDNRENVFHSTNLSDVGFAIPLARGVGFGVSLTQTSTIGYESMFVNDNEDILSDIGRAVYTYYGEGGVSQLTASVGTRVVAGLSVGVSMHYEFGSLDRTWDSELYSLLSYQSFRKIRTFEILNVSHIRFTAGLQYQARIGDDDYLTFGATYSPRKDTELDQTLLTYSDSGVVQDTVALTTGTTSMAMAEKFAGGVYYNNTKFGIGFDYSYQDWRDCFDIAGGDVTLGEYNDYRIGAQYTPDRNSVRSFFARMTYKFGLRYQTSYLCYDGKSPEIYTMSLGFDMPIKSRNLSAMTFGVEYGYRGATDIILKETFFNVFMGLSLFGGDDMWFVQRKFN